MNDPIVLGLVFGCLAALWLGIGYVVAQARTGLAAAWWAVAQWLMIAVMLGYPALARWLLQPIAMSYVLLPFVAAVGLALIWRSDPRGPAMLLRRYPNGVMDIFLLRRPNRELKRRVRSKGR